MNCNVFDDVQQCQSQGTMIGFLPITLAAWLHKHHCRLLQGNYGSNQATIFVCHGQLDNFKAKYVTVYPSVAHHASLW